MPPAASPSGFAIYTRQSVDTAKDFSSCDAQFQTCLDCARAFGDRDGDWIGERFDDQGWSGSSVERPALKRLRQAVREGRVRHVYAVALDRLSRTMRDAVVILDELEAAGVELRLVHQPGIGTSAEGRFLRHIIASFAEFERELIAARLSDTRMSLKAHGRRLAGPPPYGYDADPKTKQLVPNAREARRLKAIFEMAASGVRPSEIARRVNKKRWTTKKRLSERSGRLIGGGAWTARQIVDVLRNPVCLGVFADKGKLRNGVHAPIIGLDMFVRAKSHLDARRRTPPTDIAGYLESLETLEADIGAAKDHMGLSEPELATLRDMTTVEIVSTRYRASRSMEDRENAMYDAIVAAMGTLFQGERVVIHCGRMHAQLSQEWRVEPFQDWNHFGVRLAEDRRASSKRIFSLACFGARGEQKHSFNDPARHPFDIVDDATADSLSRAIDAAADGRIAFVDLRNTGVIGGARIDFDSGMSSTARPGEQFSGLLMYPRASVLPSSVWYETNFRD